jgi:hypothetical protein
VQVQFVNAATGECLFQGGSHRAAVALAG